MAEKKSSPVVWIVLTVGGVLAMLCFGTFLFGGVGMLFGRGDAIAVDTGEIPASGKGVAIPPSQAMTGSPIGLWFHGAIDDGAGEVMLFLPDGQFVRNPTLGGGQLVDLDASPDKGTFKVEDGQMFYTSMTGRFRPLPFEVADESITVGDRRYVPLTEPTNQSVVGTWRERAEIIQLVQGGSFQRGEESGTWHLDGYKFDLTAYGAGTSVSAVAGLTPGGGLVIDRTSYQRQ